MKILFKNGENSKNKWTYEIIEVIDGYIYIFMYIIGNVSGLS